MRKANREGRKGLSTGSQLEKRSTLPKPTQQALTPTAAAKTRLIYGHL